MEEVEEGSHRPSGATTTISNDSEKECFKKKVTYINSGSPVVNPLFMRSGGQILASGATRRVGTIQMCNTFPACCSPPSIIITVIIIVIY